MNTLRKLYLDCSFGPIPLLKPKSSKQERISKALNAVVWKVS